MKKWPLHPKLYKNELLSDWIYRIAKVYEIGYPVFCKKVLLLNSEEICDLSYFLPEKALNILSAGTGIPIDELQHRNLRSMYPKATEYFKNSLNSKEIVLDEDKSVSNTSKDISGQQ